MWCALGILRFNTYQAKKNIKLTGKIMGSYKTNKWAVEKRSEVVQS